MFWRKTTDVLSALGRLSAVAGEGLLVEEVSADEEGGGSEEGN